MKLRIVKSEADGLYYVERKWLWTWYGAMYNDFGVRLSYLSEQEAECAVDRALKRAANRFTVVKELDR